MSPFRILMERRSLVAALVSRDLRTRYAGSAAGLAWAVLNPLFQIVILTTVFSLVLRLKLGRDDVPFGLALAWGFLPWLSFQDGLSRATTALVDGGVLVRRMAFPGEVLVAQTVLAALTLEVVAIGLLILVGPAFGSPWRPGLLLTPIPLLIQAALMLGLGFSLGILHVYLRDTAQIVSALLQAWFYLTPIVYALEDAPAGLRTVLSANPMSGVVESFRALALGLDVPWSRLAWSGLVAAVLLAAGARLMARGRAEVPDLV